MRKSVIGIAFTVLALTSTVLAVPRILNYQGRLLDSTGQPVSDGTFAVTFTLYNVSTGGSSLWQEIDSVVVEDGIFSTLLGKASNEIPMTAFEGTTFLSITVGTEPEISPRTQITSVGYAIKAGDSELLDGHDASYFQYVGQAPNVFRETKDNVPTIVSPFFGPTGALRHITGVYFHNKSGSPSYVTIYINGQVVLGMVGAAAQDAFWGDSSAPIEVGPSDIVEISGSGFGLLLVTGLEY